jgi:hypothetical protein
MCRVIFMVVDVLVELYIHVCVLQLTSHAYKRQNKLSMRELNDHFLHAPVSF